MDKLLSSFEVEVLEGQAQPVDLVAALPVKMHLVPGFCLRQLQLIPLVLILKIWLVDSQSDRPQKGRWGMRITFQVTVANILQASKLFQERILHRQVRTHDRQHVHHRRTRLRLDPPGIVRVFLQNRKRDYFGCGHARDPPAVHLRAIAGPPERQAFVCTRPAYAGPSSS